MVPLIPVSSMRSTSVTPALPLLCQLRALVLGAGTLMAQTVKNPPAMQESWVQSLGWEDPLEGGMATHFSILAWRIPWTEEPGGLMGCKESERRLSH